MLLILLAGCEYLEEQRETPAFVYYGGTVLSDPADSSALLTDGELRFRDDAGEVFVDDDGEPLDEAERPYADSSPGYWRAQVPADVPFQLTVAPAADGYPAVFRGRTPSGDGVWFTSFVFSWPQIALDEHVASMGEQLGAEPTVLSESGLVHLWGSFYLPEAAPGDLVVTDGAGNVVDVHYWVVVDEDTDDQDDETLAAFAPGAVDPELIEPATAAPVTWFTAFDLEPGEITITSGELSETYTAEAGSVVTPAFFYVEP